MSIEEVKDDNGIIVGYRHYTDDYGIPCDKSEASGYNFVLVDIDGKPIADYDCIIPGVLGNPNRKKSPYPY